MFQRSRVQILVPYTGWTFFHIPICCKNSECVFEKMKIYEKEAGIGPFFLKKKFQIYKVNLSTYTVLTFLVVAPAEGADDDDEPAADGHEGDEQNEDEEKKEE